MSDSLVGIRVLDLTRVLAGPYGTMLMADMGAEVIKIEALQGDPIRTMGPPFIEGESAYFLGVNRNKKSVAIDLKSPEGRELFLQLAAVSDVVIDNFRPGVMQRLGIGSEELRATHPHLITCSISAYGSSGPYRDLPGFDLIIQAVSGAMSITGSPDGAPVRMGVPLGDLAGGMMAAVGIASALVKRARTGRGEHIDLSLLDSSVSLLTYVAQYHLADGKIPGPIGSGHQTLVPYQAFRTADESIVIAVATEKFWPLLCAALELDEMARAFPTNATRRANSEEVLSAIQEKLLTERAGHWLAKLRVAGVPAGPVNTVDKVVADQQVIHRGMIRRTSSPHPRAGTYDVLGNPIKMQSVDIYRPAPMLGEQTSALLRDLLGMDDVSIKEMAAAGIVGLHADDDLCHVDGGAAS